MKTKSKNIRINSKFEKEISVLCEIMHTNFSNKTKELLFKWKTEEINKLRKINKELYTEYLNKIK